MSRNLFVLLAVMMLAASVPAECKTRGASTPHERARALSYVQSLEDNPLAKGSLEKRLWLTEWLVKVPDVQVNACCRELESLEAVNETYATPLRMQAIYSQAAFILQHPHATSEAERMAAGLAGALRAYQAIQRVDPSAQYPVLDNLLSLEKQGKLVQYVEQRTVCSED